MSSNELTPFSYVVLTLVGQGGASAHDLVRMARQGRVYADFADSQYYAEPKRLAERGYLKAAKEPGQTRERTRYTLTAKGRRALVSWMDEPVRFSRMQLEPAWRVLAADLVGDETALRGLRGLRAEIADLLARLDVAEAVASTLPHRERYIRLNHRLARRLVEAHEEWLDEVERELGSGNARRARSGGAGAARGRGCGGTRARRSGE